MGPFNPLVRFDAGEIFGQRRMGSGLHTTWKRPPVASAASKIGWQEQRSLFTAHIHDNTKPAYPIHIACSTTPQGQSSACWENRQNCVSVIEIGSRRCRVMLQQ
jgi:hypothetical protein